MTAADARLCSPGRSVERWTISFDREKTTMGTYQEHERAADRVSCKRKYGPRGSY